MPDDLAGGSTRRTTRVLKAAGKDWGNFRSGEGQEKLGVWDVAHDESPGSQALREAARLLRTESIPVGFPTETVYGLGADATRSAAVKGIYAAKGRPSDNPLIVHVSDLEMLRDVLRPAAEGRKEEEVEETNGAATADDPGDDSIPRIYKPLIERFWPGPLTILLPNPRPSRLAPEVTAGLASFGARMPASPLARSLIKLAGAPLAAPSANASTRPSPTTAVHVLEDLGGRVDVILDGGPCRVGVESTVVDGLCDPPVILRPGGVGVDELRSCPGWEGVETAYKDQGEAGKSAPRAPGMKYKHYSPRARVILYEATSEASRRGITLQDVELNGITSGTRCIGVIRTRHWPPAGGLRCGEVRTQEVVKADGRGEDVELDVKEADLYGESSTGRLMDVCIGKDTRSIAQGLFSALRELDRRGADIIFVEGTVDDEDIGAAVMNRLRKAASQIRA
ncbi:DHBP synthase RibB-like alpha/beta domain-containing protein [Xylariaceae sp. FL0804]|nr:DHBP synthase RibB-like alpha/beta domain-containing protein [Xylariaceae sp. FL0804]